MRGPIEERIASRLDEIGGALTPIVGPYVAMTGRWRDGGYVVVDAMVLIDLNPLTGDERWWLEHRSDPNPFPRLRLWKR